MSSDLTEALWTDPNPSTPEGQRLWSIVKSFTPKLDELVLRDIGQRICQIEAEAREQVDFVWWTKAGAADLARRIEARVAGLLWSDRDMLAVVIDAIRAEAAR